jgi:hypothetical protein
MNKARCIIAGGLSLALLGAGIAYSEKPSGRSTLIEKNAELRKQIKKERKELRYLKRIAAPILRPTPTGNRKLAQAYFGASFSCADEIITGETAGTWDHTIWNYEGSGAFGLGQAMPRDKMLPYAYAGLHPYDNPMPQLVWFEDYAEQRYGSVCGASAHWTPNGSW